MTGPSLEVTLQPLDRETDLHALALELGLNPTEIRDWHTLKFAVCMPDFPACDIRGDDLPELDFGFDEYEDLNNGSYCSDKDAHL